MPPLKPELRVVPERTAAESGDVSALVKDTRLARVGDCLVDFAANRLTCGGVEIRLAPKSMAVFRQLILNAGTPLSREDLLRAVWHASFTSDDVLNQAVSELRRALDDDPKAPRYIETLPKIGYRLLAPVQLLTDNPAPNATERPVAFGEPGARPWPLLLVLVALLLICGIVPFMLGAPPRDTDHPRSSAGVSTAPWALVPKPVTVEPQPEWFPNISPDGASVVYTAIYLDDSVPRVYLGGTSASPRRRISVGDSTGDSYPVWSPNGTQVAFLRLHGRECRLVVVAVIGGQERDVAACPWSNLNYLDWTPDGSGLVMVRPDPPDEPASNSTRISFLDLDSGQWRALDYETSQIDLDLQPRFSPEGTRIAFRRGLTPYSDIYWVSATGGKVHQLTHLRAQILGYDWLPDGRHMVFSSDHSGPQGLFLLDVESGAITNLGVKGANFPAAARHKPLVVFHKDNSVVNLLAYRLDQGSAAKGEALVASTKKDTWPQFSPVDDRLAFVSERSGQAQIWLYDPTVATPSMLTHHEGAELTAPNWSADGKRIVYTVRSATRSALYSVDVASHQSRAESVGEESVRFGTYSADGHWLLYVSDRSGEWQLWRRPSEGGPADLLSGHGAINAADPFGDDSIYFKHVNQDGLYKLSVTSREETRVSDVIGLWNSSGWQVTRAGIYYVERQRENAFELRLLPTGASQSQPVLTFSAPPVPAMFTIARDGKRVIVPSMVRDDVDVYMVDLTGVLQAAH